MKILITGASGFIGSRLLDEVCHAFGESNVVAFSSKPIDRCACIVHGSSGDWNLNEYDAELIASVETVIHAGAYTPKTSADANVIGGCNGNILFTEKLLGLRFDRMLKLAELYAGNSRLGGDEIQQLERLRQGDRLSVLDIANNRDPGRWRASL